MAIQQHNKMLLGFLPLLCGQNFKKSRCKKLLKISISRIHLLKNRRVVQVKQLRRDVAQLLQYGEEESARSRVARLWKEQNLLSAYDTIGQYCKLVLPNLANIGGQRSCPADLMEPLSSLIFAASSCADLPELQDLREILASKYGNELHPDSFVNEGILGSFSSRGPSEAAKQELLEGIAKEYNLSPRFWPRIAASLNDMPANVEKISVKRLPGPLPERPFNLKENSPWREENEKISENVRTEAVMTNSAPDEARDSEAANGKEPFVCSLKQTSFDAKRTGEHDFDTDERETSGELHDVRHQKVAKSVITRGNVSARKVIERGDVPLVLCSPANGNEAEADSEDAISLFIPKTSFPKPPRRPPPPPPIRVASSPSLYVRSPPRAASSPSPCPPPPVRVASSPSLHVESPPRVSYQRATTLESYRFGEHRDAHVHPKLPEYDDLVARFAALKLKTMRQ